jgi:hypothetical protein
MLFRIILLDRYGQAAIGESARRQASSGWPQPQQVIQNARDFDRATQ